MLFIASYFTAFFRATFKHFSILGLTAIFIVACGESSSSVAVSKDTQDGTGKLNDTGAVWAGNSPSGNNATCTSNITAAQDCDQGRDAQAAAGTLTKVGSGEAGFDYTKLDEEGEPLVIQNGTWETNGSEAAGTKWSCVRDNVTGLIWEVKVDDGTGGDKDNTYRWGGAGSDSYRDERYNDWNSLIDYANSSVCICGFHDWRVPTIKQLVSLVNYNQGSVTIDQGFFPNANSGMYWASTATAAPANVQLAWTVNFASGNPMNYTFRNTSHYVRLVSTGKI